MKTITIILLENTNSKNIKAINAWTTDKVFLESVVIPKKMMKNKDAMDSVVIKIAQFNQYQYVKNGNNIKVGTFVIENYEFDSVKSFKIYNPTIVNKQASMIYNIDPVDFIDIQIFWLDRHGNEHQFNFDKEQIKIKLRFVSN